MKATLLSTLVTWFYWSWGLVLIVRLFLNHFIYDIIGKEEIEKVIWIGRKYYTLLLCLFTFRWREADQEDKNPKIRRMMRIGNVLSIVFIIQTAAAFFLWVSTF